MKSNFNDRFQKLKIKMGVENTAQINYEKLQKTKKTFFKNKEELETGKLVSMSELFIIDDVFTYDGIPVVIYIKDHSFGSIMTIKQRRKIHLFNCGTIKEMKEKGRFNRYVSTTRIDGIYKISRGKQELEKSLEICKNCKIKMKSLTGEKIKSVKDFLLSDFITKGFNEKDIKYDQNSNVYYPPNWNRISEQLRKNSNYTCQKCHKTMMNDKKNLHVHHKNGVKQDVSFKNLEVLCYECHSNEPGHSHMKKNKFGTK